MGMHTIRAVRLPQNLTAKQYQTYEARINIQNDKCFIDKTNARAKQVLSQLQSSKFYAYSTLCSIVLVQKKNWDKDI